MQDSRIFRQIKEPERSVLAVRSAEGDDDTAEKTPDIALSEF